jgi:hypothetical protein
MDWYRGLNLSASLFLLAIDLGLGSLLSMEPLRSFRVSIPFEPIKLVLLWWLLREEPLNCSCSCSRVGITPPHPHHLRGSGALAYGQA